MNIHAPDRQPILIGRKDKVDFPELALEDIDVKVDTGAYTSSIHCHNIERIGTDRVRFNLLDPTHAHFNEKEFILPFAQMKDVKSSSGTAEERIFITTAILIFGELIPLQLSLTDRSDMKYPVLLGRKLLKHRFIVDVSKINLSYKAKRAAARRAAKAAR